MKSKASQALSLAERVKEMADKLRAGRPQRKEAARQKAHTRKMEQQRLRRQGKRMAQESIEATPATGQQ